MRSICFLGFGYTAYSFVASYYPYYNFYVSTRNISNIKSQTLNFLNDRHGIKTGLHAFKYEFGQNNYSNSQNSIEELIDALITSQIWLVSIPPQLDGNKSKIIDDLTKIVSLPAYKARQKPNEQKLLIYLSSISVYGQRANQLTTETDPCQTKQKRGKDRYTDEKLYQGFCDKTKIDLVILRLAGIYGIGRSVLDRIELKSDKKLKIYHKQNHFFNAIYIKDLIMAIDKIICSYPDFINQGFNKNNIINITDGNPLTSKDKWCQICEILKISNYDIKLYKDEILPTKSDSFWKESKIVSNQKLREVFDFDIKFSNYIEGFRDILKQVD